MDVNNIKTTIGTFNKLNIVIFIGNNQKLLTYVIEIIYKLKKIDFHLFKNKKNIGNVLF